METVVIKEVCLNKFMKTESKKNRSSEYENEKVLVEEIVKLERRIFPKHESLASSLYEELQKRNCGMIYACAAAEKKISLVGYVMYSWPSCLHASINKLAVREEYRRQGHGEALLMAAVEKCKTRNVQSISLHVDPIRTAAVSLYQKLG
ncbi:hypothetical protein KI387_037138, partial [Taxus chinensis]